MASILWEPTFNQQLTEVLRAQRITRKCLKRCRCGATYSHSYSHTPASLDFLAHFTNTFAGYVRRWFALMYVLKLSQRMQTISEEAHETKVTLRSHVVNSLGLCTHQ